MRRERPRSGTRPRWSPTAIAPAANEFTPTKPLAPTHMRERRQRLAAAEVEEIDHQQVRDAAQHGRVRVGARSAADRLPSIRAHAISAPSTLPSAKAVAETATVISVACTIRRPQPEGRSPSARRSRSRGDPCPARDRARGQTMCRQCAGVMSKPNHFVDIVFTVPSATAALTAASNFARSSGSPLRRPTATPKPSGPPP